MQQVDPAYLFEMGDSARNIRRLVAQQPLIDSWVNLSTARNAIHVCVYQSIYSPYFRSPLVTASQAVIHSIDTYMAKLYPQEGEGQSLLGWEVSHMQGLYTKFETILISELQSISNYIVTRKSGFDIGSMIEAGRSFFSADLESKVPEAIADLDQAMRCIAFEVPTAAGFHLHRGNEAVLRFYWDSVTEGRARPKQRNMGVYLSELERADKGNKLVRAHLQSIKDFHRNPLMHPEQSLETIDEAIDLMSAIRCAIGYMLKEIPMREASPSPHLSPTTALKQIG